MPENAMVERAEEKIDFPWLIFRLDQIRYAINSELVSTITILPAGVETLPDCPDYVRGIFDLRGTIVPLLELRKLFQMTTLQQEYGDFVTMMDARKEDHLHWVSELKRSIEENVPFTLTADPHQCAFGQWYDNFQSDVESVNHHLRKIDLPHQKLHAAAHEVQTCKQEHENCQRKKCLKQVCQEVEDKYVPVIVRLMDEAKEVFRSSFREMVIVLGTGGRNVGVIVDDVLAVESLTLVDAANSMRDFCDTRFVTGVGKSEDMDGRCMDR